jgi:hypothetical protein
VGADWVSFGVVGAAFPRATLGYRSRQDECVDAGLEVDDDYDNGYFEVRAAPRRVALAAPAGEDDALVRALRDAESHAGAWVVHSRLAQFFTRADHGYGSLRAECERRECVQVSGLDAHGQWAVRIRR